MHDGMPAVKGRHSAYNLPLPKTKRSTKMIRLSIFSLVLLIFACQSRITPNSPIDLIAKQDKNWRFCIRIISYA